MKRLIVASLLLTGASLVLAGSKSAHETVRFDPEVFETQRVELVQAIRTGEQYSELSEQDTDTVLKSLDTLGRLLAGVPSIESLSAESKVKVFNEQNLINELLTQAARDSRIICKRETPVGTRLPTSTCKSAARWAAESERSVDGLRKRHLRSILPDEPKGF